MVEWLVQRNSFIKSVLFWMHSDQTLDIITLKKKIFLLLLIHKNTIMVNTKLCVIIIVIHGSVSGYGSQRARSNWECVKAVELIDAVLYSLKFPSITESSGSDTTLLAPP